MAELGNLYKVGAIGGIQGREVLVANRTYFVNVNTGNDSNTGLSVGDAFQTIKKAIETATVFDLIDNDVTISVADGTYPINDSDRLILTKYERTSGVIKLIGNLSNPENVILQPTASWSLGVSDRTGIIDQRSGVWEIGGLSFSAALLTGVAEDVNGIIVQGATTQLTITGDLLWKDVVTGGQSFQCLLASNRAYVRVAATLKFDSESIDSTGKFTYGVRADESSGVDFGLYPSSSGNITFEANNEFSDSTFFLTNNSFIRSVAVVYTGTNTATNFFADGSGVVLLNNGTSVPTGNSTINVNLSGGDGGVRFLAY